MYPENYIIKNFPDAHWTYHIFGYFMDSLIFEKVKYSVVLRSYVFRTLVNDRYNFWVNQKLIAPLENLEHDNKLAYWNESANHAAMIDDRIQVCKAMYICDLLAEQFYSNERSI